MHGGAWELALAAVDEALAAGAAPSLARLGPLGRLGALPSFIAALETDDPGPLVDAFAREREALGLAPVEVAGELLALGRVLEREGETRARERLDGCLLLFFERVTAELAERARRDPLTGLLNHAAFHGLLATEVGRARRYRARVALVLLDVDRFKEANDAHGHREGDRLLRALGAALLATARETDAVGRVGGDEFAALLLEADGASVRAFLERLRAALPERLAVSAGAAFLPGDAATPERLLELADRRLYESKRARAA